MTPKQSCWALKNGCSNAPAPPAVSHSPEKPGPGWYSKLVNLDFVKKQAAIPKIDGVLLIDARPAARKYDLDHIPTAISLPDSQFEKLAAQMLPADKGAALYFYCEGVTCVLSNDSARKAIQLGYSNVKVVPEGYPAWEKPMARAPPPLARPWPAPRRLPWRRGRSP